MSETKDVPQNETEREASEQNKPLSEFYWKVLPHLIETNPDHEWDLVAEILMGIMKNFEPNLLLRALEAQNKVASGTPYKRGREIVYEIQNMPITTIPLRIDKEPLTTQTLAITFTALTELITKLWLIAKSRFADLVEYTQTRDVRFASEAGLTIAWVKYNSPFNFGLNIDLSAAGVATATMTVVNGITQRKAHLEQLELENQAAAQKIKEAEQQLKQQQEMAAMEREKQVLELEKLRLENEKERQTLVEQRLESHKKQIEDALDLAGKAVDIVYPNADAEMRSVLIQTVMNNILQLQSATGLELALPAPRKRRKNNPTENTGQ